MDLFTLSTSKNLSGSQAEKFRELARELECDESEERFDSALKRVAEPKKAGAPKAPTLSDAVYEKFERDIGRNNRDKD